MVSRLSWKSFVVGVICRYSDLPTELSHLPRFALRLAELQSANIIQEKG
jgi:hypothetical protein